MLCGWWWAVFCSAADLPGASMSVATEAWLTGHTCRGTAFTRSSERLGSCCHLLPPTLHLSLPLLQGDLPVIRPLHKPEPGAEDAPGAGAAADDGEGGYGASGSAYDRYGAVRVMLRNGFKARAKAEEGERGGI